MHAMWPTTRVIAFISLSKPSEADLNFKTMPQPKNDYAVDAQMEMLRGLGDTVEENLNLMTPPERAWQPSDFLPDLTGDDWADQVRKFRQPAGELSDEVLVVLVGDMVTEEALPNYAVALNLLARDDTGDGPDAWARWTRGWTAEENRHGDLLNGYLRLTGRVDMRSVEVTVQHLIRGGFNPRAYPDPYAGLVYTAFQERATRISHANVARLAVRQGDENLATICRRIAGDEARHEQFYTRMMGAVMDRDPERAILIFRAMMKRVISMPGRLMFDGEDHNLFDNFATVAQRLGVYTAHDYASIVAHLVDTWEIGTRSVSGKAAAAQDFLCAQAERLAALADAVTEHVKNRPPVRFGWLHGRTA